METDREGVLFVLRKALWNDAMDGPCNVNWRAVFEEMQNQKIAALIGNTVKELGLEPELQQAWIKVILRQLAYNEQYFFCQDSLLKLMEVYDIPCVILKGAAAAQYYPKPNCRAMGDVDLLVPPDRFDETVSLLLANGYHQQYEMTDCECEVELWKNNVAYEVHRAMNVAYLPHVDPLNSILLQGFNCLERRTIDGYSFPILPDMLNGLSLLSHIRQHMRSGIGLRQIVDWMMYVNHSLSDARWHDSFQQIAARCGLEQLAITVTRMCQLFLGLPEDISWCVNADQKLCCELMDYLFDSGNFGCKIGGSSLSIRRALSRRNGIKKLFFGLQENGKRRPIIIKHSWLRPIAWLLQAYYYTEVVIKDGFTIKKFRKDYEKAHQLQEMLHALGIE